MSWEHRAPRQIVTVVPLLIVGKLFDAIGVWECAVLILFVGCGVSRLARYNVTAEKLAGDDGKVSHYEGAPIPTSMVLVALLAAAAWQGRLGEQLWSGEVLVGPWLLHPLVLLFAVSGSLMISTIRIPKP